MKYSQVTFIALVSIISAISFAGDNRHVSLALINDLEKKVAQVRQKLEAAKQSNSKQIEQTDLKYQLELENQRLRAAKLYIEAGKSKALGLEQEMAKQAFLVSNEQINTYRYIKYEHSLERLNRQEGGEAYVEQIENVNDNEKLAKDNQAQALLRESQRLNRQEGGEIDDSSNEPAQVLKEIGSELDPATRKKQIQSYLQYGATRNESLNGQEEKERLDLLKSQVTKRINQTVNDIKTNTEAAQAQALLRESQRLNRQEGGGIEPPSKKIRPIDTTKKIIKSSSSNPAQDLLKESQRLNRQEGGEIDDSSNEPAQVLKEIGSELDPATRKKQIQSYLQYGATKNKSLSGQEEKERLDLLKSQVTKRINQTVNDIKTNTEAAQAQALLRESQRLNRQEGQTIKTATSDIIEMREIVANAGTPLVPECDFAVPRPRPAALKKLDEEDKKRLKAKKMRRSRGMVQFPTSAKSPEVGACGSFHYSPDQYNGNIPADNFTNPLTGCVKASLLSDWDKKECPDNTKGCRLSWGNISHEKYVGRTPSSGVREGEDWPHKSHTSGKCFDIRLMRTGNHHNRGFQYNDDYGEKRFDLEKTKKLINMLKEKGATEIYFNDPRVHEADSAVSPITGHKDHVHACFRNNKITRNTCKQFKPDYIRCPMLKDYLNTPELKKVRKK